MYPSSWPFLLPSRDSERLPSAIQPLSPLGQLFGVISKFLQRLCQNSIQIKKWTSAFFPKPHTSVAEPSLDTKYQGHFFFLVCCGPWVVLAGSLGWVGCTALGHSYGLRHLQRASCLGHHSFHPTSVVAKALWNNIFNRTSSLRRPWDPVPCP